MTFPSNTTGPFAKWTMTRHEIDDAAARFDVSSIFDQVDEVRRAAWGASVEEAKALTEWARRMIDIVGDVEEIADQIIDDANC